ncbi:MAG: hypothetical protein EOP09_06585 [Proteobacteria bacterium]|nr:MAG: hypothetical protein EOP09_06585 [Pseudomonadota bacterium]
MSIHEGVVFLVFHTRDEMDESDVKLIGVFSRREAAQHAVDTLRVKPGFRDFPSGFEINEYIIDRMEWMEGFGSPD